MSAPRRDRPLIDAKGHTDLSWWQFWDKLPGKPDLRALQPLSDTATQADAIAAYNALLAALKAS